jgi:large subunit ribosomal protein L53
MTEVVTKYNPFNPAAKSARLFLNQFPANARSSGLTIKATVLPRSTTDPNTLYIKFSA